ncbi:hypothetical protein BH10PAT2_BH10PAT2_1380 [soil metagenome]
MSLLSQARSVTLKLFLVLGLLLSALVIPTHVLAAGYGECGYGTGKYNQGADCNAASTASNTSSGSSSSSSSPGGETCSAAKPASTPDLFQITPKVTSLTLFFTPSSSNRDRYFVSYGSSLGSETYGFEFINSNDGVISVDVNALKANTVYYFRVRAGNGCMPGDWSNELAAKTCQRFPTYRWSSASQIIKTAVSGRAQPSTITKIQVDSSKAPAQSPLPAPQTKVYALTQVRPATSPNIFQKIGSFFTGLFKK